MELTEQQLLEQRQHEEESKKVLFKFHRNLALVSSKIVKLNNLQKAIVDGLLGLLEKRINDTYS